MPQQWNYAFRLDSAEADGTSLDSAERGILYLNGTPILAHRRVKQTPSQFSTLHVATTQSTSSGPRQVSISPGRVWSQGGEPRFVPLALADLTLSDGTPHGFAGTVDIKGLPLQRRQDNALGQGSLLPGPVA